MKENELRLLCVLPQKRGNGAGTRLFRFAEDYIRSRGYERMEIGGAGSGLLIGAPEDTCGFFEKMGCTLDDRVAEMSIGELNLPDKPLSGADFEIYTEDSQKLYEAVAKVDRTGRSLSASETCSARQLAARSRHSAFSDTTTPRYINDGSKAHGAA